MSTSAWLQILFLIALLAISTPILGSYLAKIYGGGRAPGDRVFLPVEKAIYRVCRVDPEREQRWNVYAYSLLAFSAVSGLILYLQLRLQGHLPLNPDHLAGVPAGLSFNTAMSFLTNTNWQNYSGESTMSYLTQTAGLAWHNFLSAAVGICVALVLARGLTYRLRPGEPRTLGNFWVDLIRSIVYVLLPICIPVALVLVSQGVIQNFSPYVDLTTLEGAKQSLAMGPVASQEVIQELGTNGGGFF